MSRPPEENMIYQKEEANGNLYQMALYSIGFVPGESPRQRGERKKQTTEAKKRINALAQRWKVMQLVAVNFREMTFAAAPYVARMVESSIKEVPFGVIEAAQSMGASPWQIVWKVLVPEAKPSLMVGGAISIVTILGYSAMAGFIGGGGLGTVAVNYGYNRYNFPIMLIAVIIIVVVVQIFQEVGMRLAHRLDKRNR